MNIDEMVRLANAASPITVHVNRTCPPRMVYRFDDPATGRRLAVMSPEFAKQVHLEHGDEIMPTLHETITRRAMRKFNAKIMQLRADGAVDRVTIAAATFATLARRFDARRQHPNARCVTIPKLP